MSRAFVFSQFGGPEHQVFEDRAVPPPGPGELLVEVRAAGVNPADWKMRQGLFGTDLALPAGLGSEVSGVVTAVGEQVDGFMVGDEVLALVPAGNGGLAEHTIVRAAETVAKPAAISFVDAAAIPVAAATAYDLTHAVELGRGQTMLVLGAGGGVGLVAAQIARVHKFGAIGVASESKREVVESTGATWVQSGPGWVDRIRELAPDGVDLVVDLVGGETLREAMALVKRPDLVISAADPTVVDLGGRTRPHDPEALANITSVIAHGLISPNVTATFPLDRADEAMARVESGHSTGKTVVEVS